MMKVGITGGIGSGKSTVCRLFAQRGVAVYDSDAAAKRLMTEEPALRAGIAARFGAEAYAGGALNRPYLAAKVFSDPAALADLNALVHPAVMADFCRVGRTAGGELCDPRSAILFEAGLEGSVDRTVAVLARWSCASNAPAAATVATPKRSAAASPLRPATICCVSGPITPLSIFSKPISNPPLRSWTAYLPMKPLNIDFSAPR